MTFPQFDKLFDDLISRCRSTRDTKGQEYANSPTDRLANFKEVAEELGIVTIGDVCQRLRMVNIPEVTRYEIMCGLVPNPKAVLAVYWLKHVRSIQHWVKTGEVKSTESIEGRIVDAITYLSLLWGLEIDGLEAENEYPPTGK